MAGVAALLWLAHLQGLTVTRNAPFLGVQGAMTALLLMLAVRAWRHRVLCGQAQRAPLAAD